MEQFVLRAGGSILVFVTCFILFFHLLRRYTIRVGLMILVSASLSLPFLFLLYRFDASFYRSETNKLLDLLLQDPLGLGIGLLTAACVLGVGFLLSREAWLGRWLWIARRISPVTYRCLRQLLIGAVFLYFTWLSLDLAFLVMCLSMASFALMEYSRLNPLPTFRPILKSMADRWIGSATISEVETKVYLPSVFFLGGILISLLLFPECPLPSIAMAALTDPLSGLMDQVGKLKLVYSPHKTIEGFICFLVLGWMVLYLLHIHPAVALATSLIVCFFESICVRGGDNLLVPVMTGLTLQYFSG